ncbi:MFS transporter [Maricaulis sp.]|uniref:MFS transporter n=1 Tax=Maricaulis sp. TaxID=1486257 RepID=UPI00263167FE|nr:MFS transporter [Maricaulis sp.]
MTEKTEQPGPWSAFKSRAFLVIWTATLIANTGTWMRDVASGWLMTDLAPSPAMVALVQAATTLPIFVLALPAGALADIIDRRKMLIVMQSFLLLVAAVLAVFVATGTMTVWILLGLTFAGGIGAAMTQPAFQAVVPELVERPQLRSAVALNSMGINVSRAIGPALGGTLIAVAGVVSAYILDAIFTLAIILAFLWWKRPQPKQTLPAEAFFPAMATGLGYVARSGDMHRVLVRAFAFFFFGSAYWALLPLIARTVLEGDATFYGLLMASIGTGAVLGAVLLPRFAKGQPAGRLVLIGSLATMIVIAALALIEWKEAAIGLLFVAGGAWIIVLTNLNVAAQSSLPNWVRARGLAIYLTVFFGAMTVGSILWGQLAARVGIEMALFIAAGSGTVAAILAAFFPLPKGDQDLTPSGHWPEPSVGSQPDNDRGPVMISIEYQIPAGARAAFLEDIYALSRRRKRDGAYGWRVFEDAEHADRFTEVFFAPSWLAHLRQHERVTKDDAELQDRVRAHHAGEAPPQVRHQLAAHASDKPAEALPHDHSH